MPTDISKMHNANIRKFIYILVESISTGFLTKILERG